MLTKHNWMSWLSAALLGGVLTGAPVVARAAEPTTAEQARELAQHYREQAEHYKQLGGVGYKTGLVQRAEADAAKYSSMAETLPSTPAAEPGQVPEAAPEGAQRGGGETPPSP
jgi:hypothetical protein